LDWWIIERRAPHALKPFIRQFAHRFILLLLGFCGPAAFGADPPHIQKALPVQPRSVVYTITNHGGGAVYEDQPNTERQMVDRLVLAVTGAKDLKTAWSSLVKSTDTVGLKISAAGGPIFSTHHGVVSAVVSGLQLAGVPRNKIIIFDRNAEQLAEAGFTETRGGPFLRSIEPPKGYDAEAVFTAPILGQLIWGDVNFRGIETGQRRAALQQAQNSPESHLARIVSKQVTKIINLPTFSDARGCGIAGALYNVTVPLVDNSRRFAQPGGGASSIPDLYADARLGGIVALTIVDGLMAQYAGGPEYNPNYAVAHRTLLASKDPVALDGTIFREIEAWRRTANLPSLAAEAAWLQEAETIGLGTFDASRITLQPLPAP
jgi:hypothetical protein